MMRKPTIEEILTPKPEARPRIYAYSIADKEHAGLLKVGQTTRDVKQRVSEQLKTANIKNYTIFLDESAERDDGTTFTDHEVRAALARKGCAKTELEWMRCTLKDVKTVLTERRTGLRFTGKHSETFGMRAEQRAAVEKTHAYFHSIWKEDMHAVPRFLWNAKMRFGKTFTSYQLARKLGPSGCSWSLSNPRWRMRGRRTSNPTWISTAGNTSPAIPTAIRRASPPSSHSSISAPSRICWAATTWGTSSRRTRGFIK